MTVLIIEDDPTYGYALTKALTAVGRTPVLCDSWKDYLQRVETDIAVRSVVIDVRLPAGTPNGVALARMTRLKKPGLKVIVISNHPELLVDLPEGVSGFPKSVPVQQIAAAATAEANLG